MIRRTLFSALLVGLALWMLRPDTPVTALQGEQSEPHPELSGFLADNRGQAISDAEVLVFLNDAAEAAASTTSSEDGSWVVDLPGTVLESVHVEVERHHYESFTYQLAESEVERLRMDGSFAFNTIVLENQITLGFWVAAAAFVFTLLLIASERLQNALAALAGISIVFAATFILGAFNESFYVLNMERALAYINWEVIFLVMGMMIVVGILEGTGIFQWLAFQAYRVSRGRISLLIIVLIVITSVASALLDNVTTMLLMAPISLQIALALGIDPLALLIPEILASNISGISTLIGTPTNILIGAYAGIGFNDFLINQTLGVLGAMVVMIVVVLYFFRGELKKTSGGISEALYNKLKENAQIKDARTLKWSGVVFGGMLFFFIVGESLHMVPSVTALLGATLLLLLVEPDIEKMLRVVDWTTLVFFMALFMLVGAVQEVGLLGVFAEVMGNLIGANLPLGIVVLVFGAGLLSFVIANIPLTAAMLPVVRFVSAGIPGAAESHVLYYALSMGAAMGGNGFIISGETNLMTSGIAERAGYPISFARYLRIGVPVTLLTLAAGTGWLFLRFALTGG